MKLVRLQSIKNITFDLAVNLSYVYLTSRFEKVLGVYISVGDKWRQEDCLNQIDEIY